MPPHNLVSDQTVRYFVRRHPLEFDLRKVDQLWLVDLAVGGI